MKYKLLLALTWAFMALGLFSVRFAYAENYPLVMSQQLGCEDWAYNDNRCPAFLPTMQGKAAFGEPTAGTSRVRAAFCGIEGYDWNFNDPTCAPQRMEGKAAYGEPIRTVVTPLSLCVAQGNIDGNDWNFNDPGCQR